MNIDDVKNMQQQERRRVRINIRMLPSQLKFINDNHLCVARIMDTALNELGYKAPDPSKIHEITSQVVQGQVDTRKKTRRGNRGGRGRSKGNVYAQRRRRKQRGR